MLPSVDRSEWGDDDAESNRPPLPPEDRLWRHPSELGARGAQAPLPLPIAAPSRSKKPIVVAAAAAGVLLVAATGASIRLLSESTPRTANARELSTTLSDVSSTASGFATTLARAKPVAGLTLLATVRTGVRQSQAVAVDQATLVTTMAAVTGSTALAALLPDGRRITGSLLGVDKDAGVAVVGLNASSADPDTTGTAVPLHTGDKVWMAGYESPGTITGTGRSMSLPDGTHIHHAFEVEFDTDKVKEGQALIDHDGKVVGLCTRDASGDVVGIPIDLARSAATSLRAHKKLVLPYLGVTGGDQGPTRGPASPTAGPSSRA